MFLSAVGLVFALQACLALPLSSRLEGCNSEPNDQKIYDELRRGTLAFGLDPLRLEDFPQQTIEFRYQLSQHTGKLLLTNGWLQDASTLVQSGPTTYDCFADVFIAYLPLGFDHLSATFEYSLKFGVHSPEGRLTLTFDGIRLLLMVIADTDTGLIKTVVLRQEEAGSLLISSTNLGSGMREPVEGAILDLFRNNLNAAIISGIQDRVGKIMESLPPIPGLPTPTTVAPTTLPTSTPSPTSTTTSEEPSTTEGWTTTEEPSTTDGWTTSEEPSTTDGWTTSEEPSTTDGWTTSEEPSTTEGWTTTEEPSTTEGWTTTEEPSTTDGWTTSEEPSSTDGWTTPEEPSTTEGWTTPEEPSTTEGWTTPEEPSTTDGWTTT